MKSAILLVLMIGSHTFAQGVSALDPAVKAICMGGTYDSVKKACLDQVYGHQFQSEAVQICSTFEYTSAKVSCLEKVEDTRFVSSAHMEICSKMEYSSSKLSCLLSSPKMSWSAWEAQNGNLTLKKVAMELKDILALYDSGRFRLALEQLTELSSKLSRQLDQ